MVCLKRVVFPLWFRDFIKRYFIRHLILITQYRLSGRSGEQVTAGEVQLSMPTEVACLSWFAPSTLYFLNSPARFWPAAKMRPAGIEPTTVRLEGGCSIQLSYERDNRCFSLT